MNRSRICTVPSLKGIEQRKGVILRKWTKWMCLKIVGMVLDGPSWEVVYDRYDLKYYPYD